MNTSTVATAISDGVDTFWDLFNNNLGVILGVTFGLLAITVIIRFARRRVK